MCQFSTVAQLLHVEGLLTLVKRGSFISLAVMHSPSPPPTPTHRHKHHLKCTPRTNTSAVNRPIISQPPFHKSSRAAPTSTSPSPLCQRSVWSGEGPFLCGLADGLCPMDDHSLTGGGLEGWGVGGRRGGAAVHPARQKRACYS